MSFECYSSYFNFIIHVLHPQGPNRIRKQISKHYFNLKLHYNFHIFSPLHSDFCEAGVSLIFDDKPLPQSLLSRERKYASSDWYRILIIKQALLNCVSFYLCWQKYHKSHGYWPRIDLIPRLEILRPHLYLWAGSTTPSTVPKPTLYPWPLHTPVMITLSPSCRGKHSTPV